MKYKLLKNKLAYSIGFTWVFSLVTLFGLGVMFIVFDQVFLAHLVPTIKNQVNSTAAAIPIATQNIINANIDKYMTFWHALPFILFFVVVIYMVVAAIRKESDTQY